MGPPKMEGQLNQESKPTEVFLRNGVSEKIGRDESVDTKNKGKLRLDDIIFFNVIFLAYAHIAAIHAIYLCFTSAKMGTIILNIILTVLAVEGVAAGAHRLWSHRSYKAKLPLQILLMLFFCVASQQSITTWVRNHRIHHKFSDTDADPHNINRGFFFSHAGWLMLKKNKEASEKAKTLDMSDIYSNPVLMFQKKYVVLLITLLCYVIPTAIPMYYFDEKFINSFHITLLRFCYTTNVTLMINSISHRWGYRPYDKRIAPAQHSTVTLFTLGEGYHNYHHVFPWDYRSSEWGNDNFNLVKWFIDFFEKVGWAYDLKSASPEMSSARAEKTGDGSECWGSGRATSYKNYEKVMK